MKVLSLVLGPLSFVHDPWAADEGTRLDAHDLPGSHQDDGEKRFNEGSGTSSSARYEDEHWGEVSNAPPMISAAVSTRFHHSSWQASEQN